MKLIVIDGLLNGLRDIAGKFLTFDNLLYLSVGFTLLMILFFAIKSVNSYECKLERSVSRLNNWLIHHNQTLNESNLVQFNNLIKSKKSPKILRQHWQQYMLYRDKLPSEYISAYNCIDKPSKTSSFATNIKNFISIYITTAVITFVLSLVAAIASTKTSEILPYLTSSLLAPAIVIIIGLIATLIMRSIQNNNLASLYQSFHVFNRFIDKASATIPKYVDFEILFTKKEIREGIPTLGEYLEKRARQEQEELEEAQRNAVSHEEYDFSASGVDGSLVLERAMRESETFLNFKQRTLAEIQQFESEISTLKKNYENTSKDYQRKLQASKENMERLRQQQEESTNRIEVNYIRKQQQDEVKKQEQLERDQEDATNKFNTEINSLSAEIEKRRTELESRKLKVQEAMESEYQTFSAQLHKTISTETEKFADEAIQKIANEKDQYAQAITYLKSEVDNKDAIIEAKDQIIEELQIRLQSQQQLAEEQLQKYQEQPQLNSTEEFETEEYQPEETPEETAKQDGHYDEQGYYWYNDGTYYDANGQFHDLQGNVYDADGNLVDSNQPVESETVLQTEETQQDEPVAEAEEYELADQEPTETEETQKQTNEDGHYDEKGYYWYNDGTYYDANGLFHDLQGNVYDADGNLVDSNQPVESEIKQPNVEKDVLDEEEKNVETLPLEEPVNKEPSRKGRPRKEQTESKPKRSVGRPKKEKDPNEENKPKRSVGRPKKEKDPNEENKPKRSVGRPKKTEAHDILKQLGQSLLEVSEKQSSTKKTAKRTAKKS